MVTLNEDIVDARRKLLGAVGKLNKALQYTGYEKNGTFIGLKLAEFSPDELIDINQLLGDARQKIAEVESQLGLINVAIASYVMK